MYSQQVKVLDGTNFLVTADRIEKRVVVTSHDTVKMTAIDAMTLAIVLLAAAEVVDPPLVPKTMAELQELLDTIREKKS